MRLTIPACLALGPLWCSAADRLPATESWEYKQLFTGFNGPFFPGNSAFEDRAAVERSWLAKAMGQRQLEQLLSSVDFKAQILIAVAIGKRDNVTGSLMVSNVRAYRSSVSPYVRIGVNEGDCQNGFNTSYPFALIVIERPKSEWRFSGYDHQNFPDGCKEPKSGSPNDDTPTEGEP
jgi:hypothetical protein